MANNQPNNGKWEIQPSFFLENNPACPDRIISHFHRCCLNNTKHTEWKRTKTLYIPQKSVHPPSCNKCTSRSIWVYLNLPPVHFEAYAFQKHDHIHSSSRRPLVWAHAVSDRLVGFGRFAHSQKMTCWFVVGKWRWQIDTSGIWWRQMIPTATVIPRKRVFSCRNQ